MLPTGESTWHPVSSGILDCYYNVTHLPAGVTVRFRVACVNRAGQGPFSNPSEKVLIRGIQGQWTGGGGGRGRKGPPKNIMALLSGCVAVFSLSILRFFSLAICCFQRCPCYLRAGQGPG